MRHFYNFTRAELVRCCFNMQHCIYRYLIQTIILINFIEKSTFISCGNGHNKVYEINQLRDKTMYKKTMHVYNINVINLLHVWYGFKINFGSNSAMEDLEIYGCAQLRGCCENFYMNTEFMFGSSAGWLGSRFCSTKFFHNNSNSFFTYRQSFEDHFAASFFFASIKLMKSYTILLILLLFDVCMTVVLSR